MEVQLAIRVSKGKVYEEKDGERMGESLGAGVVLMLVKRRERRGDRRLFNLHVALGDVYQVDGTKACQRHCVDT